MMGQRDTLMPSHIPGGIFGGTLPELSLGETLQLKVGAGPTCGNAPQKIEDEQSASRSVHKD